MGNVLSDLRTRALTAQSWVRYQVTEDGRRSLKALTSLRDQYRGQRCIVIGNGPSLRQTDLSPLRDEFTFGLNRSYLLFDRLGFSTTFLVAVNRHVIEQCADELTRTESMTFLSWFSRRYVPDRASPIYLRRNAKPGFYGNVRKGVWEGATVTYVALQLAYHMGFSEAVLIGVDHSFATQGPPNQLVVSKGDDPNHFDPNYFGKGFRWQLPDLETSEFAYEMARRAFAADGRTIVDATVGGKLQVFEKVDYSELFGLHARATSDSGLVGLPD